MDQEWRVEETVNKSEKRQRKDKAKPIQDKNNAVVTTTMIEKRAADSEVDHADVS